MKQCRVAVVGGGPAGVSCGRFLKEAGHQPVIFESGTHLGGVWAPNPTNAVVYKGLVTNIPTACMQSFDLDFPVGLPSYITGADLCRYVDSYAGHFGLRRSIRLNAHVNHIHPLRSEEEERRGDARWLVKWSCKRGSTAEAAESGEEFDAVVVASGHYSDPYRPEVPGQNAWLAAANEPGTRKVYHAVDFNDPNEFSSRAVLVVGGRSSGVDISRLLKGTARWVYALEKGCKRTQTEGNCTHVPFGGALRADGHLQVGDEVIDGPPVDAVMLATGYEYSFPFLDSERLGLSFGPLRRWVDPLYMHAVHARRPSLCFVGIPLAVPCPIPLFEAQARFVASCLRQQGTSADQREAWVMERRCAVGDRPQDLHMLGGNAFGYMRDLVRAAGLAGSEYEHYCNRLAIIQAIHEDRTSKQPRKPWGDAWYRQCEYEVDWTSGEWKVIVPSFL